MGSLNMNALLISINSRLLHVRCHHKSEESAVGDFRCPGQCSSGKLGAVHEAKDAETII